MPQLATNTERYEAVLRVSEALASCREPEELAKALADKLSEFISFDHLKILVLKENSHEIEWIGWGKGGFPAPDRMALGECWDVLDQQEAVYIPDWNRDERLPAEIREWTSRLDIKIGAVVGVRLNTPHRRIGKLVIASAPGVAYGDDDIIFMRAIARVVAFAIDDGLNVRRAQYAQACVEQQRDRLQLLLNLTNSITSNLELSEVLRAIAGNIRQVMRCDAAGISLRGEEPGTFHLYALDFPGGKGFVKEGQILTVGENDPAMRAIETLKPVIANADEIARKEIEGHKIAAAEGIKTICFIPLVNRGRALGTLTIARSTDGTFTQHDIEFLSQAAGQIAIAVENALAFNQISELKDKLAQEKVYLEDEIRSEMHFEQIVGSSAALKHMLELVETVAPNDSTVLLLGETGTGKELVARAIHDRSQRKDRTFVKLNCAAIPTGLLESELFGHEKGAFTGAINQKIGRMELADKGTLFLDEVGDIPSEIQPKLLRALQEREFERLGSTHTRKVNVRLIAATNRDLEKMVADREFRSDLYYRLNVFPIRIPPLRDRREDIPLLVSFFVQKFAKQLQKKIDTIPAATMKGLVAWEWPGNIRELENFIERAVILTRGKSLEAPLSELRKSNAEIPSTGAAQPVQDDIARIVKETIDAALNGKQNHSNHSEKQREQIVRALTDSKGQVGGADGAAARMGINRTTLISRMKKFGIDPHQYA